MENLELELSDIQGNIVRAYRYPVARHLMCKITNPPAARLTITKLLPGVTNAEWWVTRPLATLNVCFTYNGLQRIGVPTETLGGFPFEFRQGMRARAQLLRDVGPSSPDHWDEVWRGDDVDVMLSINAQSADALERYYQEVLRVVNACHGVQVLMEQNTSVLVINGQPTSKEHFGFNDGVGNPEMIGGEKSVPGRGKLNAAGQWEPLAPGEFLLGQIDESGEIPAAPDPHHFSRNGTFVVYRKLHQNVASFRKFLAEEGAKFPGGLEKLAAKMSGRWRDGTPLALSPDSADQSIANDPQLNNDFRYHLDPDGLNVPRGAHIRRMNPRDGLGFDGAIVNRRRIMRRGLPYGTWTPEDQPADDTGEHGIIFMAINASIERQFEFVQQQWANYGNDFGLGNDPDPLIGNRAAGTRMLVPGTERPHFVKSLPQFVETRGGAYFFKPSITCLQLIGLGRVASMLTSVSVALRFSLPPLDQFRSMIVRPLAKAAATQQAPKAIHSSNFTLPPAEEEGLLDEFANRLLSLVSRVGHRIEDAAEHLVQDVESEFHSLERHMSEFKAKLKNYTQTHPEVIFAVLRHLKPIYIHDGLAMVTRFTDVQEVLGRDDVFGVTYGPKMLQITGGENFFLGMAQSSEYQRDTSNMRLAVRREDVADRVAGMVRETAAQLFEKVSSPLEVVNQFARFIPARVMTNYFGLVPDDEKQLIADCHLMFRFLFIPDNPPEIDEQSLAAAARTREWLDRSIQSSRGKTADGSETVLSRLFRMQTAGGPGLTDLDIRNNLIGLLIGAVPTCAKTAVQALDVLLGKPDALAGAQAAARDDNRELFAKYVFEALRFNPNNPGLLRIANEDYVLAEGSFHATKIPKGMMVLAATQSAMFDDKSIDDPHDFNVDRPSWNYMHFGFGLHECFGRFISGSLIPGILWPLLRQPGLRRADGDAGQLQMDGPYPSSLTVEFDRRAN